MSMSNGFGCFFLENILSSFGGYSGERCIPHAPFLVGIAFRRQGCCHATDHPNRAVNASGPLSTNDASPGARTQLSNFATLDLLLSVAQDVAAMPAERRKAASGAAARRRLADLRESKRAADRGYGPPLTPAQEAALGYSLHRDAPWGQRRQPKARSPASIQAGCIPTPFSSKPTPSPPSWLSRLLRSRSLWLSV